MTILYSDFSQRADKSVADPGWQPRGVRSGDAPVPKVPLNPPPRLGCFPACGSAASRGNSERLRPLLTVAWAVTSHAVTAPPCPCFPPRAAAAIPGAPAGAGAPGRGERWAGRGTGRFAFLSNGGFFPSFLRSCFPLQFCFSIFCTRLLKAHLFTGQTPSPSPWPLPPDCYR